MKKCATCGSVKMKAGGAKKMGMGGMHMMPDGSMMKNSMMKAGGSSKLKPVNSSANPGLSKLPRAVRNKMGYAKKGGATGKGKK